MIVPSKALPTRQLIDAAVPDHPVFVQRLDGHMGVANSLAIKLAGVTRDTAAPDGGAIVRDAANNDNRMSSFVLGVANSAAFRMAKAPEPQKLTTDAGDAPKSTSTAR